MGSDPARGHQDHPNLWPPGRGTPRHSTVRWGGGSRGGTATSTAQRLWGGPQAPHQDVWDHREHICGLSPGHCPASPPSRSPPVPKVGMSLAHQDPEAPPEAERWLPPAPPPAPLPLPRFSLFPSLSVPPGRGCETPQLHFFWGGTPQKAPRMGREALRSHLGGGFIHSSPQRSHEGFCSAPGGQLVAGRWGPLAPRPPPPVSPGVPRPAGRCRGGVRAVPAGSEP